MRENMFEKNLKAMLFDMDWMVIDSMPYHFISLFEVLRQYNVLISLMFIFEVEGVRLDKVVELVFKRSCTKLFPQNVIEKIPSEEKRIFNRCFKKYIFDDMSEFIKSFKNKNILVVLV